MIFSGTEVAVANCEPTLTDQKSGWRPYSVSTHNLLLSSMSNMLNIPHADGQAKPESKDIDNLCKTLKIESAAVHSVLGEGCE